jgi:hypothetical protein
MVIEHILAHPELQQEDPEFDAWCDKIIEALEEAKGKIVSKGFLGILWDIKGHMSLLLPEVMSPKIP